MKKKKKIGIVDFVYSLAYIHKQDYCEKKSGSELTRVVFKHTSFHVQCLDHNTVTGERA